MQYLKCLFVTYIVMFIYNKLESNVQKSMENKILDFDKNWDKAKRRKKTDNLLLLNGLFLLFTTTTLFYILGSFMLW